MDQTDCECVLCTSVGRVHQCAHRGGRGAAVPAVQTAGHDPDQPGAPQQPGEGRAIMLYYQRNICIYLCTVYTCYTVDVTSVCIYMLYCMDLTLSLYLSYVFTFCIGIHVILYI